MPHTEIDARLELWSEPSTGRGGGPARQYVGTFFIGNPSAADVAFDTFELEVLTPAHVRNPPGYASAVRLSLTPRGTMAEFSFVGPSGLGGPSDERRELIELPQKRAVSLIPMSFGPLRPSVAGKEPVGVSLRLLRDGRPVSEDVLFLLPPIERLGQRGQAEGMKLEGVPGRFVAARAGVTDQKHVAQVFAAAGQYARDARLLTVAPDQLAVHHMHTGQRLFDPSVWLYEFLSETRGPFIIPSAGPGRAQPSRRAGAGAHPDTSLTESLLGNAWLDADLALIAADAAGAEPPLDGPGSYLSLRAATVQNLLRPLWFVPHSVGGAPAAIAADTGELLRQDGHELTKVPRALWNA